MVTLEPRIAHQIQAHGLTTQAATGRCVFPELWDNAKDAYKNDIKDNPELKEFIAKTKALFKRYGTRADLLESGPSLRNRIRVYRLSKKGCDQLGLTYKSAWPAADKFQQQVAVLLRAWMGEDRLRVLTPSEIDSQFPELRVGTREERNRYYFSTDDQGEPKQLRLLLVDCGQDAKRIIEAAKTNVTARVEQEAFRGLIEDRRFAISVITFSRRRAKAIKQALKSYIESDAKTFRNVLVEVEYESTYANHFGVR